MPGHPPAAAPPRQAHTPADHRRVNQLRRDLQRAVPLHSRHADIFRYGPDGDSTRVRASYGVDPKAIYTNVEYSLRELGALYLRPTWRRPRSCCTTEGADGPEGNAIYQRLRAEHARAAGIDYPELTERPVEGRHVRLARVPQHRLLDRHGELPDLPGAPNGLDPDSCIFDVQGFELPPSAGLPTAQRQFFADWRQGQMGEILTQDFSNMSEVTAGLHSMHYNGHHLNTAQEMTIWNYHRALDNYLFS